MASSDSLARIVADLIRVLQQQTRLLEETIARIEQTTGHLGTEAEFGVIASELAELAVRLRQWTAAPPPERLT